MTGRQPPRSAGSLAALLLVALAAPVAAAPAKVTAQAERKDAQVGQPVLITVRVRGAADTPTVKPPTVAGAQLVPVGQPASVPTLVADLQASGAFHGAGAQHIANMLRGLGQMPNVAGLDPDLAKLIGDPNLLKGPPGLNTNDYLFTYQVTPERSGPLVVPAFNVTTDRQTTATPPLSINVTEARPQPWVQMRLSLSDPMPDVGTEVQLYVDLLIQRAQVNYGGKPYAYLPVSKVTLTLPPLDGVKQIELVRPLDRFVEENAIEPGKRGFRINNFATEVKMEHEPADGKGAGLDPARYRRRLAIPLRVREGGQVTLAAAHAAGEVFVPAAGNKGQWEPFVATSEPVTFTILDLRKRADRPADFSGAVGNVRVTAEASQTQMPAGTPFTLTVRLQGNGSVSSAGAPDLAARPEFAGAFKGRLDESRTVGGNVRQFTYTLRPLSEKVTEVPPVPVSYFDPKANKFGTAQSEPIALRVAPAANATPDAPAPAPPPPAAPPPEEEPARGFRVESLLPWAEGAMAVAALAVVVAWGVRRLRGPRPAPVVTPVEPARPLPVALPRLKPLPPPPPPPTFAEVRQRLQDFLRRHFQLPPGEVTPHDAGESLRRGGVSQGLARSFAALLDTCETAEFAPGVVTTSPSELAAYARQLMDQILTAIPEVSPAR